MHPAVNDNSPPRGESLYFTSIVLFNLIIKFKKGCSDICMKSVR